MSIHRTVLVIALAAQASGCGSVCLCAKREAELQCPTDIRKTVPWCAGEDAIMHCPCGPSEDFYGHKPTCWRTWPAPATVWRDAYCGGSQSADHYPIPSDVMMPTTPGEQVIPLPDIGPDSPQFEDVPRTPALYPLPPTAGMDPPEGAGDFQRAAARAAHVGNAASPADQTTGEAVVPPSDLQKATTFVAPVNSGDRPQAPAQVQSTAPSQSANASLERNLNEQFAANEAPASRSGPGPQTADFYQPSDNDGPSSGARPTTLVVMQAPVAANASSPSATPNQREASPVVAKRRKTIVRGSVPSPTLQRSATHSQFVR